MRNVMGILAVCSAGAVLLVQAAPARVIAGQKLPPLVGTIVEGRSMAGVAIGMTQDETNALWGKPKASACHGGSQSEPPGSPGYELGGLQCDWDIELTVRGISEGLVSVFYAPKGFTDDSDLRVRSMNIFRNARLAKYRRWRTTKGIGLGSSLESLKRAYGGRLRQVPPLNPVRFPPAERFYYVTTSRDGGRWVTFFPLPTGKEPNSQARAWEIGRVAGIEIMSSASFRQYVDRYARRGWRP